MNILHFTLKIFVFTLKIVSEKSLQHICLLKQTFMVIGIISSARRRRRYITFHFEIGIGFQTNVIESFAWLYTLFLIVCAVTWMIYMGRHMSSVAAYCRWIQATNTLTHMYHVHTGSATMKTKPQIRLNADFKELFMISSLDTDYTQRSHTVLTVCIFHLPYANIIIFLSFRFFLSRNYDITISLYFPLFLLDFWLHRHFVMRMTLATRTNRHPNIKWVNVDLCVVWLVFMAMQTTRKSLFY